MTKKLKQTSLNIGDVVEIKKEYISREAKDLRGLPLDLDKVMSRDGKGSRLMIVVSVMPLILETFNRSLIRYVEVSTDAIERVVSTIYDVLSGSDAGLTEEQRMCYQFKLNPSANSASLLNGAGFPLVGGFVSLPECKFVGILDVLSRRYENLRTSLPKEAFIPEYSDFDNVFIVLARGPEILTLGHVSPYSVHFSHDRWPRTKSYIGSVNKLLDMNVSSRSMTRNILRTHFKGLTAATADKVLTVSEALFESKKTNSR